MPFSFDPPDRRTATFYETYAGALASTGHESSRSALMPFVERYFTAGDVVLDVGAGSGRDVAAMLALGIEAFGIEPNAGMREHALAKHPALQNRMRNASLPSLGQPFADLYPAGFDGVVCSAVLMHVTPGDLPIAISALVGQLRQPASIDSAHKHPKLLISFPAMEAALLHQDRDHDGRLFHNHAPARLTELLKTHGLMLDAHETSDAVLASTGTRWHTMVFIRAA